MAVSVTIPNTLLALGPHTFGPATVAGTFVSLDISIDRTIAGGLNATPAAVIAYECQYSTDSGTTWRVMSAGTMSGTETNGDTGGVLNADTTGGRWNPPLAPGEVRTVLTVSGSAVRVAGSLTAV